MLILIQTRDGRQLCVNLDHVITVEPQEGGSWLNLTSGKRLSVQMEPGTFLNDVREQTKNLKEVSEETT